MGQIKSPMNMPDLFGHASPGTKSSSGKTPISGQSAIVNSALRGDGSK